MKALDVISYFDNIRPNSFDYKTKKMWLMSLETDIRRFAYLHSTKELDNSYTADDNPDLFLDEKHMDMYAYYLVSMADMTNAEYSLYNISSTYFNSLFAKWKRHYRSENIPELKSAIKL